MDQEHHLYKNGTRIVKFLLHISKDEQRKESMNAYEECLGNSRLIISETLVDTLKGLDIRLPAVGREKKRALEESGRSLERG